MQRIFLSFIFSISLFSANAQSLYMPRNVQDAFKKGTRSNDGKPGKNYWQNFGRYNITVTAMPPDRNIKGSEQITYINNSSDTLRNPVIKLIMNIHKPGALRFGDAGADYLSSGIHIDTFKVNEEIQQWNDPAFHYTWQSIPLPEPLMPHDSVKLGFSWHYELSLQSGREGMIDSTTYFLAYFYPRVAVFDDYNGWDRLNFTDAQEFYNDFNDYTLTVNVPKNYIVWATGVLQNPNDVLLPPYAQKLKESMTTDNIIRVATKQDLSAKSVTVQNNVNTWKWKADYVPDVTFALSDHFNWDASSVVVDDAAKRRVSVQAA